MKKSISNGTTGVVSLAEYRANKEKEKLSKEVELSVEELQERLIEALKHWNNLLNDWNSFLRKALQDSREYSDKIAQDWKNIYKRLEVVSEREKSELEETIRKQALEIEKLNQ